MWGDWKFHHAGVIVRDARKACEAYRALGFDVVVEPYVTPPKQPDNPMSSMVCFVERGGILLEIMQPLEGRWIIREHLDKVGEGINHICFLVADIEAEKRKMIGLGYEPIYGASVSLGTFSYFDTRSIGNTIIELLQMKPGVTIKGDAAR